MVLRASLEATKASATTAVLPIATLTIAVISPLLAPFHDNTTKYYFQKFFLLALSFSSHFFVKEWCGIVLGVGESRRKAVREGTLAGLLHDYLVCILRALQNLLLFHHLLFAAHASHVATAHISRVRVIINAHDGEAFLHGDLVGELH